MPVEGESAGELIDTPGLDEIEINTNGTGWQGASMT